MPTLIGQHLRPDDDIIIIIIMVDMLPRLGSQHMRILLDVCLVLWLIGLSIRQSDPARGLAALQRQQARLQRIYERSRDPKNWLGFGVYLLVSILVIAWALATHT